MSGPALKNLECLRDRLRALHGQVQWLQATRRPPDRIETAPTAPRRTLRPDGRNAAAALFSDPELLSSVSDWYEEQVGLQLHELEVPPGSFRLMLRNIERATLDLDLVDSGEGLIQVLPVLTALALGQREDGPKILAIEEPESHLHPKLQRALASHLVRQVRGNSSPRVLLETHSEQLLLGIQLEVVRGNIRPEDVLVYWVHQLETGESLAEPVRLDADAHLEGNWPPGVFSHDTEVAREIIRNRRERAKQ